MLRLLIAAATLSAVLAGCTTLDRSPARRLDAKAAWALLPVLNYTETPQAGMRAEAIFEALLRSRGISDLKRYPVTLNQETLFEPAERKILDQSIAWARGAKARYGFTGAVDEWRYKVGIDGEPAVGLAIQVIDLETGEVLYSAAGGKSGWSREALSAVAQKLGRQLLEGLELAR